MKKPTLEDIEILGECYPVIFSELSQSTGRFFVDFPKYKETDETPPNVRNNQSKWVDLRPDFDGLLGKYQMGPPRITVYRKAVVWVANEFDWHPGRLKRLVDLHEWAHALHHLGSSSQTSVLNAKSVIKTKQTKIFRAASEEFTE